MKFILTALILLHYLLDCDGRPDGAPLAACSMLLPIHGSEHGPIEPSKDKPSYVVSAEPTANNKVKVTISSKDEDFQGFVLQARSKNDPRKFMRGHFTTNPGTKTINCFRKDKGTLTHINTTPKNEVVTEWTPEPDVDEDVIFRATVAKTYYLFWTELDSQPISIHNSTVEATEEDKTMDKDCFVTKGCFGFPAECLHETNDCKILLTYYSVPNGVRFNLYGHLDSLMYMAVGLSEDGKMGEDGVNECIRDKSDVIARESWNEGKTNTRTKDLPSNDYHSKYSNGLSSCSWVKPYTFESDGTVFDLVNNNYHLLLAMGEVRNGGGLGYHGTDRIASIENFNLTMFENSKAEEDSSSETEGSTETETEDFDNTVTTPLVTSYTEEHDASHGSQLFNAFHVILTLLLVGRGLQV